MKEEIFTPVEIGLGRADCRNGEHQWEVDYMSTQSTSSLPETKWRCKKCLCTRVTYI